MHDFQSLTSNTQRFMFELMNHLLSTRKTKEMHAAIDNLWNEICKETLLNYSKFETSKNTV